MLAIRVLLGLPLVPIIYHLGTRGAISLSRNFNDSVALRRLELAAPEAIRRSAIASKSLPCRGVSVVRLLGGFVLLFLHRSKLG